MATWQDTKPESKGTPILPFYNTPSQENSLGLKKKLVLYLALNSTLSKFLHLSTLLQWRTSSQPMENTPRHHTKNSNSRRWEIHDGWKSPARYASFNHMTLVKNRNKETEAVKRCFPDSSRILHQTRGIVQRPGLKTSGDVYSARHRGHHRQRQMPTLFFFFLRCHIYCQL